jgi:hypothetical protein
MVRNRLDFPVRRRRHVPIDAYRRARPYFPIHIHVAENSMSKGMDSKKTEKKKPTKTLKEKRAAKQEKKKGQ